MTRVRSRARRAVHSMPRGAREAASRRGVGRARAVYDVIAAIGGSGGLHELLCALPRLARRVVHHDRVTVVLLDGEEEERCSILLAEGVPVAELRAGRRRPLRGTVLERLVQERQPIVFSDLPSQSPFRIAAPLARRGFRSALHAPLIALGRVIGALNLYAMEPGAYGPEDVQATMAIAGALAMAVENGRLQGHVREMATTDPLTGLWNRSHFNSVWQLEAQRAQRDGGPLSVLMIDVHNFRNYNERFGHLAGDRRLVEVAELLRRHSRPKDLLARYGSDEFVVLMPGGSQDDAERVRGRLLEALTERNLCDERSAEYPLWLDVVVESGRGSEVDGLLLRADATLHRGRDSFHRLQLAHLQESAALERERHVLGAVLSLSRILELRDPYTRGHSERLKLYAGRIARALGLSEDEVRDVERGAVLHDVGKLVVPVEILNKAGPLTPDETRTMRRHPEFGENIIAPIDLLERVWPIVRHHQERWDGRTSGPYPGYPDGLAGEDIPIGARIIAVADAFDAMTTDRPYRRRRTMAEAVAELERGAGGQFDPRVVQAFLAVLREEAAAGDPGARGRGA